MSIPIRVLIIEDSEVDARLMVRELRKADYAPTWERVETAEAMRTALERQAWDVILSDYKMPHFSGPAALELLHDIGLDLPFVVVSGTIGEENAVAMMKAGAHDYILKGNLTRLAPAIAREMREAEVRQARRRAQEELVVVNRGLHLLSAVNQALLRATDEAELLHQVCDIAVTVGGYRMVWVGRAEDDPEKTVCPVCFAGHDDGYLQTIRISWDAESEWGRGLTGVAIRTGQPAFARDITAAPEYTPWQEEALKRGYRSSIALPLKINHHVLGALNLYGALPDAFPPEEMKLLTELANDLAYGITALRTREQRVRAEAALRDSQQQLAFVLDHSPDNIFLQNTDLQYMWVSKPAFPLTKEEYLGKTDVELAPEEDARRVTELKQRVLDEGHGMTFEVHLTLKGLPRDYEATYEPWRDAEGHVIGLAGYVRDTTERKQAEEEIKYERAYLSSAIEVLPLPILFFTPAHEVIRQNKASRELQAASDMQFWWTIRLLDPQTRAEIPQESWPAVRALHGDVVPASEWIAVLPDGQEMPILYYSAPVFADDVMAAVVAIQDITALKEADKAKNQFIRVISHEMRTPLTAVIGWAQLAEGDPTLSAEAIQAILHSARVQQGVLDRLILLSRILTGKLTVRQESADLKHLALQVAAAYQSVAQERRITFRARPSVAALPIHADPHLLQQAIRELLDNALKYTPAGGSVTMTMERSGDQVLLRIQDTGQGIAPDAIPRLWHPFLQVVREEALGGLGIGLVLVRGIVGAHGGQVDIASPGLGQGTTVTMELPVASSEHNLAGTD